LRDYGIEPVIWDGIEGCEHDFSIETKAGDIRFRGVNSIVGSERNPEVWKGNGKGNFCTKCGAWRGSLGLEPTFELYIKHLCDIFDEIKRVLRKDGTCWVNLGTTMQNKNDVMIPERFALEMTNPNYILRDDLTKEEKEYVLTTLINNGII